MKPVQQTCQDTDEYHHEYVYFASKEGGLDFRIDVEINGKQVEMIINTGCAIEMLVEDGPSNERECILQEYADVFKEELELFKNYEYDIIVNKEVPPKVQRQRPVPASLKSRL